MTSKWKPKLNGKERMLSGKILNSLLDYLIGGNLFLLLLGAIVKLPFNNTNWGKKWLLSYSCHAIPSRKSFQGVHGHYPLFDFIGAGNQVLSSLVSWLSHFISNQVYFSPPGASQCAWKAWKKIRLCSFSFNHLAGFQLDGNTFQSNA